MTIYKSWDFKGLSLKYQIFLVVTIYFKISCMDSFLIVDLFVFELTVCMVRECNILVMS